MGTLLYTGSSCREGSNSVQIRQYNERIILALLRRHGTASKADLARQAKLSANTVGQIVQGLEVARLIRRVGKRQGGLGQPATLLELDPEGAYAIGVKIGRRSIDTVLVDFAGQVFDQCRRERPLPLPEAAVAIAIADIAMLRARLPAAAAGRIVGLGIAAPGNMGSWRHELDIPSATYRAWNGFDLATRLGMATGLATLLENDGTAATVAELFQGHGRELNDFAYMFIGSAVGGVVVLGGDCHRGAHGNAGDIGLMPTLHCCLATAPQRLNRPEIVLTRGSINALIRHLRGSGVPITSREALEAALTTHAVLVEEWLDDCAYVLVGPLLSAAAVLDVEAVVLDGDLPRPVLQSLIHRLQPQLATAVAEERNPPPVLLGRIGRQAAAMGAAILPLHANYSPKRSALLTRYA